MESQSECFSTTTRRHTFTPAMANLRATIDIASLTVIEGELPRRALVLVGDWGTLHSAELLENWRLCREKVQPGKIEPLA
jgi:hypothetical protein